MNLCLSSSNVALYSPVYITIGIPDALIGLLLPDLRCVGSSVCLAGLLEHIVASEDVVLVCKLGDVLHFCAGHLQHTKVEGIVDCVGKPSTFCVL